MVSETYKFRLAELCAFDSLDDDEDFYAVAADMFRELFSREELLDTSSLDRLISLRHSIHCKDGYIDGVFDCGGAYVLSMSTAFSTEIWGEPIDMVGRRAIVKLFKSFE